MAQDDFDALAPQTNKADALALPLHTITVATNSLAESLHFYCDGLGLTARGPITVREDVKTQQRQLWGLGADIDWDLYLLHRPDVSGVGQIQLLVMHGSQPAMHTSWSALELGPFSMGFPNLNNITQDDKMRGLGFGALNRIEIYEVPRTDGEMYEIQETIFAGPDFVHAVGIHRGDGMSQLGAVDAQTGLGGPAYSAQVIKNSDKVLAFYTDVLGLEVRQDRVWESAGTDGALNVPDGTEFRFAILFAKGYGPGGHLLFVEYKNREPIDSGVAPRLPHRGIGMWSFEVRDLDQVLKNAEAFGAETVYGPLTYESPVMGHVRVATLLAPNNFMVEVFEVEVH